MYIANLSKVKKIKLIVDDINSKNIGLISSTIFPKKLLDNNELLFILNEIVDNIGYIAKHPNVFFNDKNHMSKNIVGASIEGITNFISNSLTDDQSIGIYYIAFDTQISKYSVSLFYYDDIGSKIRRVRESKINSLLE